MEVDDKPIDPGKQASDYAVAFDFLARITQSESEDGVIQNILLLLDVLFLPEILRYTCLENMTIHELNALTGEKTERAVEQPGIKKPHPAYTWAPSGTGFSVKLQRHGIEHGILEIDHVKFPENKEHYLNLVLSVADVCSLAIENARRVQRLTETEKKLRVEKERLESALAKVRTLRGLLPICSYCKSIRDDSGYWNEIEKYIHKHSDVEFTHSICKTCAEKFFPDLDIYSDESNA